MIAQIDYQADIDIYLEKEEVIELSTKKKRLEGVLIRIFKPKRQGTISLSINDKRKEESGFGIGIDDNKYWKLKNDFHIDVFMGSEWYSKLVNEGKVGLRQRMLDGSKIHVYDRSKLSRLDNSNAETLEMFRDRRNALLDSYG